MDEMIVLKDDYSAAKLNELFKSMNTGYNFGVTDQTGLAAVRYQSLDKTLKELIVKENKFRFFKEISKERALSTVEEYARVTGLGDAGYYPEGGLPISSDPTLDRSYTLMKYIGATGSVSNVAQQVNQMVDPVAKMIRLNTLSILKEVNYTMVYGNSANAPLQVDGIYTLFNNTAKNKTQNIIDLRGKYLTPELINQAGGIIADNYGDETNLRLWSSYTAFENYAKGLMKDKRFVLTNEKINGIGMVPLNFEQTNAIGKFEKDLFLRARGAKYYDKPYPKINELTGNFAATTNEAPKKLDSTTATVEVVDDSTSQLETGTYNYAIVPINSYGAGVAYETGNVAVSATGKKVKFTLTDNDSTLGQEATAFDIYRKLSSATAKTDYKYLTTVKLSDAVAGNGFDNGEWIPGTDMAFMIDWDPDVLKIKELLGLMKMDLAVTTDAYRFLLKYYFTVQLYAPNKVVIFKNVGSTAWS